MRSTGVSSASRQKTSRCCESSKASVTNSRRRIYSELAGREMEVPDPEHPGQMKRITVRPEISDVGALLGRLLSV